MDWQEEPILTVKDIAHAMHVKPSKVHEYRHAGLIRMFRTGSGFQCSRSEFMAFLDYITQNEVDLSTAERVVIAGQIKRKGTGCNPEPLRKGKNLK